MKMVKSCPKSTQAEEKSKSSTYTVFLKSLALCFAISFLLIIIYALILSFTSMSDASMAVVTQSIIILSITIGSIYGAKKQMNKGWLFGIVLGLLFTIVLIPLSMGFGQSFSFDKYFTAKLGMGAFVGLIGGVIGVNLN